MLYATTRNLNDVFTAHKAIHNDCAADGGLFVPFQLPQWKESEIRALADMSFGETVAEILNQFFGTKFSGWDVDTAIGRNPVSLESVAKKMLAAELWHNPGWDLDHTVKTLSRKLRKEDPDAAPSDWVYIAVAVAVIFGIYGEYLRREDSVKDGQIDLAVTTGDFAMPMAAWYARKMGLPIGNILCGCNLNGGVWDLLHHGQLSTGEVAVKTLVPMADVAVPRNLERLISGALGAGETERYGQHCLAGALYEVAEADFETLHRGMFAAVISDERIRTLIHSVYRTNGYVLGPYSALAYGALMDYRARRGQTRPAILLCQRSAVADLSLVAQCMDLPQEELRRMLTRS